MSTLSATRRAFIQLSASISATMVLSCRTAPAGSTDDVDGMDTGVGVAPIPLSKPPWVTLLQRGTARLRLETREAREARVTLLISDTPTDATPTLSPIELTYSWADVDDLDVLPDQPGLHVLQDVVLEGLSSDAVVAWTVDLGDKSYEGTFRASPGDAGFTLGWLADTMYPFSEEPIARLVDESIDLLIHGGDIQYQSSPFDTWNGFFSVITALTTQAPIHFVVGNHEFESQDEIAVMYERLAGQQGNGEGARYFSLRYGRVVFLCLDTETGDIDDPDSAQRRWLRDALSEEDDRLHTVVCMHRPLFTLSKHWRGDTTTRDALHDLFVEHGVMLVLAGHAHCYERFLVDDVHYIVDGGGGALTYDPDEGIPEIQAVRPDEIALRVEAFRRFGVTVARFETDGRITVRRIDDDGTESDRVTINGR